jgi:hypothetical protein
MAFYYEKSTEPMNTELLEAVISGKAIIFEGEEDPKEEETSDKEPPEEETSDAPETSDDAKEETGDETPEEPTEEAPVEEEPQEQGDAGTVNSEETDKPSGKEIDADQLAELFKKSGNLKKTVEIAMKQTGKGEKITLGDLLPYLKKSIVEFCKSAGDKGLFHTNAAQMGLAVKAIEKECGVSASKKRKEMEAKTESVSEPVDAEHATGNFHIEPASDAENTFYIEVYSKDGWTLESADDLAQNIGFVLGKVSRDSDVYYAGSYSDDEGGSVFTIFAEAPLLDMQTVERCVTRALDDFE